ncbi:MAG TPA: S9 family peptidase [Caulobacteraceae bacterium]|jgi:dipeptidyl aminopeptidase/acylaminoacyl peptidase|nr:S9 family peptidase [Caulobacteraceae bacterium]
MRSLIAALALTTCLATPALAGPPEGPTRTFQARDLFALEYAGDPQVRPDGGQIAFVRSSYDIMIDNARNAIWTANPDSGEIAPLVTGSGAYFSPRWSPDGKRLAYVSTVENGRPELYVRWMATGATAKIADLPEGPGDLAWSPNGRTLAFTMFIPDDGLTLGSPLAKPDGAKWAAPLKVVSQVFYRADGAGELRPGFNHIFLVDADGGSPRQVTFGAFNDGGPLSWSPDGRSLVFGSNRNANWERDPLNTEVYQLTLADGTVTALTHREGPDQEAVISPDGKLIAFTGFDDKIKGYQNSQLYVMDREGGHARSLTASFDNSVGGPSWSGDGKSIFVQYADHGATKVARVTLDGRMQTVADGLSGGEMDRPYAGGEFSASGNGVVAFTSGDATHPPELSVAKGGGVRRLTHLNADLFADKTLGKVEHLSVSSSYDKKPIDAWMILPPNFDPAKKYPLILEIHGGPFGAYGPTFTSELQLYASAGYIVVYSNPRGSTSYGEGFANEIDMNYPGHDYDDLMSVVDAAIAKGSVDPNELFVTGGSGGGCLTAWIVGKTNRFKAAVSQKPVIDWASEVLTTDGYNFMAKYWFGKMPWEDPVNYWRRSPLSLVGNITTPTMVMVGEADHRTPDSEAEQFYAALQLRGVPTALIKVPDASHGGFEARPSQEAAEAAAILAWFDKYKDAPKS